MADLIVFLWGSLIFLLVNVLVSFIFLELSLDSKKRETDGTLRVKIDGFVILFVYGSIVIDDYRKNPNNLCKLFWGIYFGLILNYIVLLALCFFFVIFIPFVWTAGVNASISQWWGFLKPLLIFVGIFIVVVSIVTLATLVFTSDNFMPATKDWVKAKKKKVCPSVKLVD